MNDQTFEDRLTEEAARHSPAFSASLHNRIMNRIASPPAVEFHPRRINWLRPLATAAAAALAVGVFMLVHHGPRETIAPAPPGPQVAIGKVPSVPDISNPVTALDRPIVPEWSTARYAYLDRDGKNLLGYVGRQLDFMPRRQQ